MERDILPYTDLAALADCIETDKCRLLASTLNQARYDEAMNADPKRNPELHRIGQQLKAGKLPRIVPFDCANFPSALFENATDANHPLRLYAFE